MTRLRVTQVGWLAALGAAAVASATEPKPGPDAPASVALSAPAVTVGDLVRATVTWSAPTGSISRVAPPGGDGRAVVVRDHSAETRPLGGGRESHREVFDLVSFEVGEHPLFAGGVTVVDGGTTNRVALPGAVLKVQSVLGGTNDAPRGYKPPAEWPSLVPRWAWVIPLVALLAALAGWGAARLIRRARRPAPPPPPPSAWETALAALAALKEKGWIERAESEPFYVELSAIVRRYIEDRFGLRAPERTTEEFLREAAASPALSAAHRRLTENFLVEADLVKFARHRPEADALRAALNAAERLVRETVPESLPAEPPATEARNA